MANYNSRPEPDYEYIIVPNSPQSVDGRTVPDCNATFFVANSDEEDYYSSEEDVTTVINVRDDDDVVLVPNCSQGNDIGRRPRTTTPSPPITPIRVVPSISKISMGTQVDPNLRPPIPILIPKVPRESIGTQVDFKLLLPKISRVSIGTQVDPVSFSQFSPIPTDFLKVTMDSEDTKVDLKPKPKSRPRKKTTKKNRRSKRRRSRGKGAFKCDQCTKCYTSIYGLNDHKPFHDGLTVCPHCQKTYTSVIGLNTHIKQLHPDKVSKLKELEYTSDSEDEEMSTDSQDVSTDFSKSSADSEDQSDEDFKVSETKKYPCSLCPKAYHNSWNLRDHEKLHSGETKCPICPAVLSTPYAVKRHLKTVHKIKNGQVSITEPTPAVKEDQKEVADSQGENIENMEVDTENSDIILVDDNSEDSGFKGIKSGEIKVKRSPNPEEGSKIPENNTDSKSIAIVTTASKAALVRPPGFVAQPQPCRYRSGAETLLPLLSPSPRAFNWMFNCFTCGQRFVTNEQLIEHMVDNHVLNF